MKQKIPTLLLSFALASVASAEYYTEGGTFASSSNKGDALQFQAIADAYDGVDGNSVTFSIQQKDNSFIANFKHDFEFKNTLIIEQNNINADWHQSAYFIYSTTGATITLNNVENTIAPTNKYARKLRFGFKGLANNHVNVIFNKTLTYPSDEGLWLDGATATFKESGTHVATFTYGGSILRADNVNLTFNGVRTRGGNADGAATYTGSTQFDLGSKKGVRTDLGFAVNGGSITAKMVVDQLGYYEYDSTGKVYERNDYLHVLTVSYENQNVAESVTLTNLNSLFNGSTPKSGTGETGKVDFVDITTMSKGDVFYSELDFTSDAYSSKLFINNKNILEYAAEELKIEKSGNLYAYTMNIPEPSTYAVIFGAIALGFVAYRRRK